MNDAIAVINENPNIPTARVTRDSDVPTRRLQRRVEKGRSRKTSIPNSIALTQAGLFYTPLGPNYFLALIGL